MSRFIALLAVVILVAGCGPKKPPAPDMAKDKAAVETAINNFLKAYETKDWDGMNKLLAQSGESMWFGTDSAEIIKGRDGWAEQTKNDWQVFESVKMGGVQNLSMHMDHDAQLASAIFEVPADVMVGGQQSHMLLRFAPTLTKENGEWRFVQGVVALATSGQSSAEMVAKMHSMKEMKKK